MNGTYYVEKVLSQFGTIRWAVRGPDDKTVEIFGEQCRMDAEHLRDMLNDAYAAGLECGLSARED